MQTTFAQSALLHSWQITATDMADYHLRS